MRRCIPTYPVTHDVAVDALIRARQQSWKHDTLAGTELRTTVDES
jgi:hypothetical protein